MSPQTEHFNDSTKTNTLMSPQLNTLMSPQTEHFNDSTNRTL